MSDVVRELTREAEAARTLLLNIRDVIGDDEQAAADAVEGETSFNEACASAVARLAELDTHDAALSAHIETLRARGHRFKKQADGIRAALAAALAQADIKKLELPAATLSRRPVAPSVIVTDEASIPSDFWKRGEPKLDRKALLAALKDKQDIPGATLSNGGETLAILEK